MTHEIIFDRQTLIACPFLAQAKNKTVSFKEQTA